MRRIEIDAEEFPEPAAEESLVLNVQEKRRSRDLRDFLTKCLGADFVRKLPPGALAFVAGRLDERVLEHLGRFSGIPETELRHASFAILPADGDGQDEIALETSNWFILYQWMTTA